MKWNNDKDFLLKLTKHKNKIIYARITVLNQEEVPLEAIEGRITGGSINIDGNSAVRRTCSLTLIGQDLKFTDSFWSFKKKFKLEIGLQNDINPEYPDILWFNKGIYLISSFSHSESNSGINISIQGKDKMAQLDGTMGGTITAQTDFGSYDEVAADGTITNIKIPIFKIILNMLHELVGEPYHNIVINDLEQYGYELWDYQGDTKMPIYYFYEIDNSDQLTSSIINLTFDGTKQVKYNKDDNSPSIALQDIPEAELYNQNKLNPQITKFYIDGHPYAIAKIEYGDVAGYHKTDLVFAGDLKANAGETLISVLDKIKNMLGEYEYFYDIDGRFVFQKKRTYVSNLFSPLRSDYVIPFAEMEKYSFKFEDKELISSCSNNPAIGEIKNDFVIWGTNSSNNAIHARFAIDQKPLEYTTFPYYERIYLTYLENTDAALANKYVKVGDNYELSTNQLVGVKKIKTSSKNVEQSSLYYEEEKILKPFDRTETLLYIKNENNEFEEYTGSLDILTEQFYILKEKSETVLSSSEIDWRELIYLMARDYYQHHESSNYELKLQENNSWCKNGKTGYEHYYADIQGFWRLLYQPNVEKQYQEVYPTSKEALGDNHYLQIGVLNAEPIDDEEKQNIYRLVERNRQTSEGKEENYYCLKRIIDITDENKETIADKTNYYQLFTNSIYESYTEFNDTFKEALNTNLTIPIISMNSEKESISNQSLQFYTLDSNYITDTENEYYQWSKTAVYSPEQLIFWFDFLDTKGELDNFSISSIGVRSKVDNNKSVFTIYNKEVPEVEFIIFPKEVINDNSTMSLSQLRIQDTMEELFKISSLGLSAAARADQLINQHVCMANSLSLTTIPIYYLEPNTRIYIKNEDLQIDGDYIISKLTIPLTYNGTMSINASKVIKQLR